MDNSKMAAIFKMAAIIYLSELQISRYNLKYRTAINGLVFEDKGATFENFLSIRIFKLMVKRDIQNGVQNGCLRSKLCYVFSMYNLIFWLPIIS